MRSTSERRRSASIASSTAPLPTAGPSSATSAADAQRLTLNREQAQDVLFEPGAALDLFGQDPASAAKDAAGAGCLHLQKGTDLTAEELADALADHFQRQAVTAESVVQRDPLLFAA